MGARRICMTTWRTLSSAFPWLALMVPFIHEDAPVEVTSWRSRLMHATWSWSFLRAAHSTSSPFLSASTVSLRSLMRLRLLGLSGCVGPSFLLGGPTVPGTVGFSAVCLGFGPSFWFWGSAWEPRQRFTSPFSLMGHLTSRQGKHRTELGPSLLMYPASYLLWLPLGPLLAGRPLHEACRSWPWYNLPWPIPFGLYTQGRQQNAPHHSWCTCICWFGI